MEKCVQLTFTVFVVQYFTNCVRKPLIGAAIKQILATLLGAKRRNTSILVLITGSVLQRQRAGTQH